MESVLITVKNVFHYWKRFSIRNGRNKLLRTITNDEDFVLDENEPNEVPKYYNTNLRSYGLQLISYKHTNFLIDSS